MKIKILLGIHAIDYQDGNCYVLCDKNGEMPSCALTDQPHDLAKALCRSRVDLSVSWLNVKLKDVEQKDGILYIVYGCIIPLDTKILYDSEWRLVSDMHNHSQLKYIMRSMGG